MPEPVWAGWARLPSTGVGGRILCFVVRANLGRLDRAAFHIMWVGRLLGSQPLVAQMCSGWAMCPKGRIPVCLPRGVGGRGLFA